VREGIVHIPTKQYLQQQLELIGATLLHTITTILERITHRYIGIITESLASTLQ
jgi:hypothetical protein